ncbi:MAG: pilin [Peptococcaceae bacterium]|jgi:threonine/homoserine/homoserine lactone efflux protein|nr:pilin [Peptococcaceae bacterium]
MNYLILLSNPFDAMSAPILNLLDMVVTPAIAIVGALGAIYCIFLGVKLARAEEAQDREKAKNALKNAIIGFLLIFILLVVLRVGLPVFQDWANTSTGTTTTTE